MSVGTDSTESTHHHHPLVSKMSRTSVIDNIATTPFARPRKLTRTSSTISNSGLASLNTSTNSQEKNPRASLSRKTSRVSINQPDLVRKNSNVPANVKTVASQSSKSGGSGGVLSPTEGAVGRASLPALTESRRMNLSDVVIWRRFTRALRQRVEEKRTEKRTFCWLDRSMSLYDGRRRNAPSVELEPSYRMEPSYKFCGTKCKQLMDDFLAERLKNYEYDPKECARMSKQFSEDIRTGVQKSQLLPPRYKCVVYVVLGEKKDQSIRVSSLCTWDNKTDSFVSSSFQNETVFCVATLFAVYKE